MTNFPISTGATPLEGALAAPSGKTIFLISIRTTQLEGRREGPIIATNLLGFIGVMPFVGDPAGRVGGG